ncbi:MULTISPECIES: hypothetical protein [Pseudomonas]|uniref:Uncharacterized protein n=1 Tax=Pseudomonas kribbensis TaxID=1628086 RepID=A0A4Y8VIT8_9PSED|nr:MULTISPECIES: hypothetical protein [Pseudomonas]TFH80362.1 hypothetical protein E4J90_12920 [Pseudomonas kribbensis]
MEANIDATLFITETRFDRQILLLSKLSNQTRLELVIWLYPESRVDNVIGYRVNSPTSVNAIPVTTYAGHIAGRCTQRLPITDDLIRAIALNEVDFIDECDSLCVYHPSQAEWVASVISHEGVILIKDGSLLVGLEVLDFKVTPHAPSWW